MLPTQTKIKRVSLALRWLLQFTFVAIPVIYIIAWVKVPDILAIFAIPVDLIPKGITIAHTLTISTKIYAGLINALPLLLSELILFLLIKLFRLYEQAIIFSLQNIKYIKRIGYLLLTMQIIRPICEGFAGAILTWGNPPGQRIATMSISGIDFVFLLTAVLIILISWVMTEGYHLRIDQQLTI